MTVPSCPDTSEVIVMDRILVAAIRELNDAHKADIAEAAKRHGFTALFFDSVDEALPHLSEAEVIFGQSVRLSQNAPKLRWLCSPSAGVEQFTAPGAFLNPDAVLTNSSGAYGVTIAEHVVMVTLEMLRKQPEYDRIVAAKQWRRDLPVRSVKDSRIAFLGTGDIGREAARRFSAFDPASMVGINRSGSDRSGLFDRVIDVNELDAALENAEILVVSLPKTQETVRLLDKRRLSLLPDGALIVNVGRGAVIDETALAMELRAGRLLAALDVFEQEPLPGGSPLWGCPNLLITPHISGNMTLAYTKNRMVSMFLEDFENYCAGRPLKHMVDLKKGY